MEKFKLISEYLNEHGILLDSKQRDQFYSYYSILVESNKYFNLTSIVDICEVEEKHFLDSVAAVSFIDFNEVNTLIDIGSGAGFPGVPLKILFPCLNIVLVDSLRKRVNFLNSLIKSLDMSDIRAIHIRAEDLARKAEYREKFDICVSRAVSKLSSLSELCLPFVKIGGMFVPYKSLEIESELCEAEKAISVLGGELFKTFNLSIGRSGLKRSFPVVKKIRSTPDPYPRKNGTPQKKPIGRV